MKVPLLVALVLAGLVVPGLSQGASFTNGSFESGINPGSFTTLSSGDGTSITGWTVSNSSIDYIGSYWTAADGSRSLDLDGRAVQGAVASQAFDTVPTTTYRVRFAMAGNPDNGPTIKEVRVSAASDSADFTFDVTGHTRSSMGWEEKIFLFVATGATTTLTLASLTSSSGGFCCWGPAVDNVRVDAVSEPTSLLLFGAMLVGVGVAARRLRTERQPRQPES